MGFQKIATGNNFVIAILEGGYLTLFGTNEIMKSKYVPIPNVTDVFAGENLAFVITSDGSLTGFGSEENQRLPISVEVQNAKQVCIAPDYVLCLQQDGYLKTWGTGSPAIPPELMNTKIASISNYLGEFSVILENGQLIQWSSKA